MVVRKPDPASVSGDTPLLLAVAAELAFPDSSMTMRRLRREIDKGNLAFERIGRTLYTTLNDVKDMRAKCRENQKGRGSTGESLDRVGPGNGSSSMEQLSAAQAAASRIAEKLKSTSRDISPKNTGRNGSMETRPR